MRPHNKEWVVKMKEVGLQPFNIKIKKHETGDNVSHSIIENGKFEKFYNLMEKNDFLITWLDRYFIIDPII